MIYLASPYSHDDPYIMESRFHAAAKKASELMKNGEIVFSPIVHAHPIAQYGLPKEWEFWQKFDEFFLSLASEIYVLMLDGWQESTGVNNEIRIAMDLGLAITYTEE